VAEAVEAPRPASEWARVAVQAALLREYRLMWLAPGARLARRVVVFWAPCPGLLLDVQPSAWVLLLVLRVPQPLVEVRPQLQAARCRVLDQQEAQEAPQEAAPVRSLGRRHQTFPLLYYNHFKIVLQFPIINQS